VALFRKRSQRGRIDSGFGFIHALVGKHIGRRVCSPRWEWALPGNPHGDGRWSMALLRKRSHGGSIDSGFSFTHAFGGEHIGRRVHKPRCECALTGNPHGDGRWAVALFRKRSHGRCIDGDLGHALDG